MYLSRRARIAFRCFAALVLVVLYFPLVYVARLERQHRRQLRLATEGVDPALVGRGDPRRRAPGGSAALTADCSAGPRASRSCSGTLAGFALSRYRFFGQGSVSLAHRAPDRAARASSPASPCLSAFERVGIELSLTHARHRARDVLRRHRLQQRRRTHATDAGQPRRGVGRPRGRQDSDVPLRDVPAHAAPRSSPAGSSRSR